MKVFRLFAAVFALLFAGCASEFAAISKLVDDARLKTRIGVLANSEVGWYTETKALKKVFLYMRQQQVDAVVIAGGVTKNGYKDQFRVLNQVWTEVFGHNAPTRFIHEAGEYEVKGFKFAVSDSKPYTKCVLPTFYGEGKKPLTDEMCFFPEDRGAIYAGSISGTDMTGFELAGKKLSPIQCLLVSVYSEETVVHRMDLTYSQPLVKDFASRKGAIYGEEIKKQTGIDLEPTFPEGSSLEAISGFDGLNEVYTLRWPIITSAFSPIRAYSYELSIAFADKPRRAFFKKSYLSPAYFAAEEREPRSMDVKLKKADLPEGELLISLTALSPYGTRGQAITTTAVIPSAAASK